MAFRYNFKILNEEVFCYHLGVYLQTDFEKKTNPPIHLMAIQTTIQVYF
jgi:hypothetical protein